MSKDSDAIKYVLEKTNSDIDDKTIESATEFLSKEKILFKFDELVGKINTITIKHMKSLPIKYNKVIYIYPNHEDFPDNNIINFLEKHSKLNLDKLFFKLKAEDLIAYGREFNIPKIFNGIILCVDKFNAYQYHQFCSDKNDFENLKKVIEFKKIKINYGYNNIKFVFNEKYPNNRYIKHDVAILTEGIYMDKLFDDDGYFVISQKNVRRWPDFLKELAGEFVLLTFHLGLAYLTSENNSGSGSGSGSSSGSGSGSEYEKIKNELELAMKDYPPDSRRGRTPLARAYKQLAIKYHPDKPGGSDEKFRFLVKAKEEIENSQK